MNRNHGFIDLQFLERAVLFVWLTSRKLTFRKSLYHPFNSFSLNLVVFRRSFRSFGLRLSVDSLLPISEPNKIRLHFILLCRKYLNCLFLRLKEALPFCEFTNGLADKVSLCLWLLRYLSLSYSTLSSITFSLSLLEW